MDLLTMQSRDAPAPPHAPAPSGPRRGALAARLLLVALAGLSGSPAAVRADEATAAIRITAIDAARIDSLLVCTLQTSGLPTDEARETIASGLPSALVVSFALFDDRGQRQIESRCRVRIEPDLLEHAYTIQTPLLERRVATLEDVAPLLARLGPLPVAHLAAPDSSRLVWIEARLAVHPLAPAEIERIQALVSGTDAYAAGRREVSIGLRSLVRAMLGGAPDEDWIAAARSPAFDPSRLGPEPGTTVEDVPR